MRHSAHRHAAAARKRGIFFGMWNQHGAFLNGFEIAATRVAALQLTGIAQRGITGAFARRTHKCRAAIAG